MIDATAYKAQAGLNVFRLEIGKFLNDLSRGQSIGKQIQNVADSNSHAPNAGAAATLIGINGNSFS